MRFAILELPIEAYLIPNSKRQMPQTKPFISGDEFKRVTNSALAAIRDSNLERDVCIIILIHGRDPDDRQNASRWNNLLTQIESQGNPLIVLGGHEHLTDHALQKNRLTVIGAPFDESKVEHGLTLPSVRFLRLYGLPKNNLTCDITRLEKSVGDGGAAQWKQAGLRRFEINPKNGHWQDMSNIAK